MNLTPLDIQKQTFSKSFKGYHLDEVRAYLHLIAEDIERLVIEKTSQRTGGNKQAAANLLGIYRPRLYSKIRKYNIDVAALVSA